MHHLSEVFTADPEQGIVMFWHWLGIAVDTAISDLYSKAVHKSSFSVGLRYQDENYGA